MAAKARRKKKRTRARKKAPAKPLPEWWETEWGMVVLGVFGLGFGRVMWDMHKEGQLRKRAATRAALPAGTMRGLTEAVLRINPNQSPVDVYTPFHLGVGAVCRRAKVSLPVSLAASVAWEWVLEPIFKEKYPEIFPAPSQDSVPNRVLDTVAVGVGWKLGG